MRLWLGAPRDERGVPFLGSAIDRSNAVSAAILAGQELALSPIGGASEARSLSIVCRLDAPGSCVWLGNDG